MNEPFKTLRRLIWLYFWLLLFEGALRKWFVPGLSNALLIVRDPVVLAIYAVAIRDHVFPRSGFIIWIGALAVLCFAASLNGVGTLAVTVYGLRANFLHLPLVLLMPNVLQASDVRRMGFALLFLLVPMAVLSIKQFEAGPSSSWNVGAGGEIGGQLFAAAGKVRASGTFSFATGLATYLAVSTAFLIHDLIGARAYPRWLTLSAVPALILALVVSGSRTAVISVAIVCVLFLLVGLREPEQIRAAILTVFLTIVIVGLLAWLTPVFHEGILVHQQRFESGGGLENGIVRRFFEDLLTAKDSVSQSPILGWGLGVGTNVGSTLMRGHSEFTLGEGEWQRVILESGPILGFGYILLRVTMFLAVIKTAIEAHRAGRSLPLLLIGGGGLDLALGQFGQPTTLGFAVFIAGLALAAARGTGVSAPPPVLPTEPEQNLVRGRSPYAERLHGPPQTDHAP